MPDLSVPSTQYGYGNIPYDNKTMQTFVLLARRALYSVGIDRYTGGTGSKYFCDLPSTIFDPGLGYALNNFQRDYGLPVRGVIGLNEWMQLLVSTGNPNRDAQACDCSTLLTAAKARVIKNDGYSIVGRYLTGTVGGGANKRDKNLTSEELETIFDARLRVFCIFQDDAFWWQDHDDLSGYFGYNRGYQDASKAVSAARALGVPEGDYIYFAVDYDYTEGEVWQRVVLHFQGINAYMAEVGSPYEIGIYSTQHLRHRFGTGPRLEQLRVRHVHGLLWRPRLPTPLQRGFRPDPRIPPKRFGWLFWHRQKHDFRLV
ncbi:glycoside hydrolase domain-containing protein [Eggerthella sinensis]|uniref:glycoside hydrolase domain-containing protein n=1 Tax=Eggerthella sinensis TaxID=242230 RepID=UPI0022E817F0|nr:glycoside hydrolase domain-containing protein [Eggerthella sinensis]